MSFLSFVAGFLAGGAAAYFIMKSKTVDVIGPNSVFNKVPLPSGFISDPFGTRSSTNEFVDPSPGIEAGISRFNTFTNAETNTTALPLYAGLSRRIRI